VRRTAPRVAAVSFPLTQACAFRRIDLYSARSASKDPTAELTALKKMVEDHMRPRLHPHQKLMLVPGLFGDRQTNRSGTIIEQQEFLLAKLNATVEWAKSDPDVIGIIPCKSTHVTHHCLAQ